MKNYIESTNTDKQWNAREWDPCKLDVATVLSKNFLSLYHTFLICPSERKYTMRNVIISSNTQMTKHAK